MEGERMSDLEKFIKIQGLGVLLALGGLPLTIKKKLFYMLMNELNIKLSEQELEEIEAFFSPPQMSGVEIVYPEKKKRSHRKRSDKVSD
jgi:hypothetical protein